MKKSLLLLLRGLFIASFFVPLLVFPQSFVFPFIVPKVVIFRSLVLLMLATYGVLYFLNKEEFRPKFSWLHVGIGIYIILLFLSTFFGVEWYSSFWDTHERMLGSFTIFHYVLYYFILASTIKNRDEWSKLQWWFLGAGSLVMGVGMLQRIYPDLLLNSGTWRVIATLGNPIYVAGYGLFLGYIGYLLGIRENTPWKKYLAFFLAFIGVLGIFLSGTRGTMIALFASVGLMLLLYVIFLKEHKKIRQGVGIAMASGILLLGIFYMYRGSSFVQNNLPSFARLLNSSINTDTGDTRLMAWKIAYISAKDHPLLGWGPNNFYYAFNKYYNPHFMYFGTGETWFDNAHNVVMNTLTTGGILGVLVYIGLVILCIWLLIRSYRRKELDIHTMIVSVAFFVGHFIHNLFVFEDPTSYLYYFFFFAFVAFVTRPPTPALAKGEKPRISKDALLSIPVKFGIPLVCVILLYSTNLNVARANNANLEAMRSLSTGQAGVALKLYEEAKTFSSPHIADIRNDFVRMGAELVQNALTSDTVNDDVKALFNKLYTEQQVNHAARPMDIRVHILQIQMDLLGNYLYPKGGPINYIADADALLQDALARSPKRQQLKYMYATVKIQQGKFDEAVAISREAVEDEPTVGESWLHLALAYAQTNQVEKVAGVFEEGQKRGAVYSPTAKKSIKNTFGIIIP
jgi:O-antigen ligase